MKQQTNCSPATTPLHIATNNAPLWKPMSTCRNQWLPVPVLIDSTAANGGTNKLSSVLGISVHTYIHPFNGPLYRTTRVSRYQKGKTNLDFTEARDSEWQWHQLDHMQVCTSLHYSRQITMPATHHSVFTGWVPFLLPNQQCQSTEGNCTSV